MIVLDSSFLIAYHNAGDVHHPAARETMQRLVAGEWGPALLPEYVFLEVTTVLLARRSLPTAVSVGETLLGAREVELVPGSHLFLDAWSIFRRQPEGVRLSFADAAILAVARRRGADRIATFDRDFEAFPDVSVVPGS